jgi:hypothetical protein
MPNNKVTLIEKNLLTGKTCSIQFEKSKVFQGVLFKDFFVTFSSLFYEPVAIAHRLFIPRGNVSPEYIYFQACDSIQATCSYLRGILAIHSTLVGVGVGNTEATALSAVATFVLKDGAGMFGSLIFSYGYSHVFDTEIKFWRLFADVINDLGLTLEVVAPLFKDYFLIITVFANICKSLCGVAAGATRVAISQHFASEGNISEVQAKEGTQETFVSMVGLMFGSLLLSQGLTTSFEVRFGFFIALTLIHVYTNYLGVKVLQLKTINRGRLFIILQKLQEKQISKEELISPKIAALCEPIIPAHYLDFWRFYGIFSSFFFSSNAIKEGSNSEGCYLRFGCSFQVLIAHAKSIWKREKSIGEWSDYINVYIVDTNEVLMTEMSFTEVLHRKEWNTISSNYFFTVIDTHLNIRLVTFVEGVNNTTFLSAYHLLIFIFNKGRRDIKNYSIKTITILIQELKKLHWDVETLHLNEEGYRLYSRNENIPFTKKRKGSISKLN